MTVQDIRNFFFNDTPPTEIYTLSLHDALPISAGCAWFSIRQILRCGSAICSWTSPRRPSCWPRSEEHTSELQSRRELVCRLLLEKKKKNRGGVTCEDKKKRIDIYF